MVLREVVERGFTHVKVKGGKEGGRDLHQVRRMMPNFPNLKWRIDFNENGDVNEILEELGRWSQEEKAAIDFLEDPLGQAFAAWEAAKAGGSEVCGLQTHGLFEANEFIEELGEVSPDFKVPGGAGLGFDDLLDALPWSKLGA
jgi:hypothetical protein